jgi:dipeptidase E
VHMFLASYRFGSHAEVLLRLLGDIKTVGVIANAKDDQAIEQRKQSVLELFDSFTELGLAPKEIDLRPFFGHDDLLAKELEKYEFVWVAGGNTFVLRKALKLSGADELLTDMIRKDEVFYGGESAGAIIATPSLDGVEFEDDPDVVPAGYTDEEVWDGLGLVPYAIVPHYDSGMEGVERMVEILEETAVPYKTLNDLQVLIVEGEQGAVLS